jgi:hypothetical protein
VFGPVFRYFDVFDEIADFGILTGKPKLALWRQSLAARPSVRSAVSADYPALLHAFIARRNSWLSDEKRLPSNQGNATTRVSSRAKRCSSCDYLALNVASSGAA